MASYNGDYRGYEIKGLTKEAQARLAAEDKARGNKPIIYEPRGTTPKIYEAKPKQESDTESTTRLNAERKKQNCPGCGRTIVTDRCRRFCRTCQRRNRRNGGGKERTRVTARGTPDMGVDGIL